jgi:hypothetical protein
MKFWGMTFFCTDDELGPAIHLNNFDPLNKYCPLTLSLRENTEGYSGQSITFHLKNIQQLKDLKASVDRALNEAVMALGWGEEK